ncbi:KTSC domain-containing protein [Actinokineospora pegani]|uniref:KTSC domain-containing protein n=1 Tax=Actinokineospora pegani TaxID=2654637 RepID=UPI0012E9F9EF|nr:KTSC domain-containing protein [Actinokineospora pegani]
MHRKEVDSTVIASLGYDAMTNTLEVEFHNGRVYRYLKVPKALYWRFASAKSHGEFFGAEIKDRFDEHKVR